MRNESRPEGIELRRIHRVLLPVVRLATAEDSKAFRLLSPAFTRTFAAAVVVVLQVTESKNLFLIIFSKRVSL